MRRFQIVQHERVLSRLTSLHTRRHAVDIPLASDPVRFGADNGSNARGHTILSGQRLLQLRKAGPVRG